MQSKDKYASLRVLSLSIGDFIRYWGFRRIHGAIWAQLYLSQTPLSCTDLAHRLSLSKALISPALDELCDFKLIKESPSPNEKTKLYRAVDNVNNVIQQILKTREAVMLKKIKQNFAALSEESESEQIIDPVRAKRLGEMILAANLLLEMMINQKDLTNLPWEVEK